MKEATYIKYSPNIIQINMLHNLSVKKLRNLLSFYKDFLIALTK